MDYRVKHILKTYRDGMRLVKKIDKAFRFRTTVFILGVMFLLCCIILVVGGIYLQAKYNISDLVQLAEYTDTAVEQDQKIYTVVKVVDGDTVRLTDGIGEFTVRLIGIDTPETVAPNRPVECYGPEASEFAKRELFNQQVYFIKDQSQGELDKYGRSLGYIFRTDGFFYNLEAIKGGFAEEYLYSKPYIYYQEFSDAEKFARAQGLGMWGECGI